MGDDKIGHCLERFTFAASRRGSDLRLPICIAADDKRIDKVCHARHLLKWGHQMGSRHTAPLDPEYGCDPVANNAT